MFVLSFFLGDDTLSIFEPPRRNSGIIGGKFLERMRVIKPGSGARHAPLLTGPCQTILNCMQQANMPFGVSCFCGIVCCLPGLSVMVITLAHRIKLDLTRLEQCLNIGYIPQASR